jgi:hypothetical protein
MQTERLNPEAMSVVARIDEKIMGLDSDVLAPTVSIPGRQARDKLAISCKAHVQQLVASAIDEHRLCRLFHGWMAFL